MRPLMNLRSVVAQVGRSMGSRRSVSTNGKVPTEVQGRVVDSLETTPKGPVRAFKYLLLGYCAYGGLAAIQLAEYIRTLAGDTEMEHLRRVTEEESPREVMRSKVQSSKTRQ